jgi:cell division protein FtsW (lipid II flippase)
VGRHGWLRRPTAKAVFLAILLAILIGYTEMAFQMDWITAAGRMGPGFFPRIIGGLAVVLTLIGLVQSMRAGSEEADAPDLEEDLGEADLGHHPKAMLLTVVASVAFVALLTSLGAIVASVIYLLGMLWFLNRGKWVTNVILSLAIPIGMYLLFQTFLNAGLPSGIIPRF